MIRRSALMALLIVGVTAVVMATGEVDQSATATGPITISIAHWGIDTAITDEPDAVYDMISEELGIEIEPVGIGWGDYRDKINLWAASGELPDAFSTDMAGKTVYTNWVANGVVHALPEDLSAYPNISSITAAGDYTAYQVNGKNWFLPRASFVDPDWNAALRSVVIRTDWLENLGLEMPSTTEEFIDTMVAFATQDPDGNGLDDTIGLTVGHPSFFEGAFIEVGPTAVRLGLGWAKENGRWVHSAVSQDTFNYYSAIRRLYEAGGLDPDFALIDQNVGWEKFASGRAGAISAAGAPAEWNKGAQSWAAQNPGTPFADVTGIVPPRPDENGVRWRYVGGSFWSETYINANVDDAKLDAILGLYEYLLSDEFRTIKNYGIEGVDYQVDSGGTMVSLLGTKDDGTAVTPADKYPFLRSMWSWATWSSEDQYYSEAIPVGIREESMEELKWEIENAEPAPVYWELEAAAATLPTFAQMNIDVAADRVNFVLSNKSPQEAWQDIVDRYNAMGYQAFEDEMNEYAASLGM